MKMIENLQIGDDKREITKIEKIMLIKASMSFENPADAAQRPIQKCLLSSVMFDLYREYDV